MDACANTEKNHQTYTDQATPSSPSIDTGSKDSIVRGRPPNELDSKFNVFHLAEAVALDQTDQTSTQMTSGCLDELAIIESGEVAGESRVEVPLTFSQVNPSPISNGGNLLLPWDE